MWLRGKLTLRQFTRERGRIIGAIVAFLVFGPMVAGATFGTAVGYRNIPDPWDVGLLGGVLVLLWIIWLVFPLVFSSVNEGMDITRLLIYPLSRRDMILGTLAGTIFDYPTYLILPLFGAMIFGFGISIPIVLVVVLAYAHAVIIGQLIFTVLGGIVQSRRFRDVVIIFFSLLGSTCYFLQQGFISFFERVGVDFDQEALMALDPLNWLKWFPTGALANFYALTEGGEWGTAVLWLGYSVLLLVIFTGVWVTGLYRLATGQGFLFNIPARPAKKEVKKKRVRESDGRLAWLPNDIAEIFVKELKGIWRVPQRRVGLLQGLIFPLFMATGFIFGAGGDTDISLTNLPALSALALPPYALFTFWATTQNMLAWEGHGLASLLLMPIPRQRIFMGKSLALFLAAGAPYVVISLIYLFLLPGWLSLNGVLTGLALGVVTLAVTAVASVMFPIRINVEVKQTRSTFQMGGGCRSSLGSILLTPIIIAILSVPAAAPLLIASFFDAPWLNFVGPAISFGYAAILFRYAVRLAGNLMVEREPELLEALRQIEVK